MLKSPAAEAEADVAHSDMEEDRMPFYYRGFLIPGFNGRRQQGGRRRILWNSYPVGGFSLSLPSLRP